MPPVIGICAVMDQARWSVWDLPAALVPMNYVEAVQRAGGMAVLVPPDPALLDDPGAMLDHLDGLMLIGGPDVGAGRYGAEPHPLAEPEARLRDGVEIALSREALARGLPLLGICRGMQLINVAAGGSLRQHLPDELGDDRHRRVVGSFPGNEHRVDVAEGTRAGATAGEGPHRVHSHHHQAVDRLGEGLRVTARSSEGDRTPEAIEPDGAGWALGVQWHPEADPDSPVIAGLVAAARDRIALRREGADRKEGGHSPIPAARRDERS
ncbi:MAG TPA: gamma-glutamyl-gamma-aminobutyrate hydrolase family protein [Miltoncostaeaceae bacterium]|nr:gamma-glutamyl-gamma-aminobutyrate hydrolase family protein [Miltoncostaeaceae bacterium]